jgi:diphthine synthase
MFQFPVLGVGGLKRLGELVFVGLGLNDELGMSLRGLEETKTADRVFIELYTSLMPDFSAERLEQILGKQITLVSRKTLEEKSRETIVKAAESGKVVVLVPGDPLIATTHVALRIEAEKLGVKTRLVHGSSILSAVMGLTGLHSYKFGKGVTVPFPDENPSETPYNVIAQNRRNGLHTLCFLDMKAEENRYLSIPEALNSLLETEKRKGKAIVTSETLAVGVARAGSTEPAVKAGTTKELFKHDFGKPPHSLVFPGKLHFMEAKALIVFAGASETLKEETL